jgi:hypothetical protein
VPQLAFRDVSKIAPLVDGLTKKGFTEESLQDLALIVFLGLKRTNADLTLDAILDMPVTIAEMRAAAMVVCAQSGLRKNESPGEAPGVTSPQ